MKVLVSCEKMKVASNESDWSNIEELGITEEHVCHKCLCVI